LLAGGCLDRRVLVWDTATDELVHTLLLPAGVLAAAFHPGGHTLATGGQDEKVVEWDVRTGMKQRVAIRHNDVVFAVAYSAQGDLLASAGGDGAVFVRRTDARRARQQRLDSTDPISRPANQWVQTWTVGFSPAGSAVAGGTDDGRLLLWNPHTQHRLRTERHGTPITGLDYSPDGSTLVVADSSETISLFDGRTGAPRR
jgi:WD40 repeat protein